MKRCTKCGEVKALTEFYKAARVLDGRASRCKECAKAAAKKRYRETREERLAYHRKYRAENYEKHRASDRASYHKNRAKRQPAKLAWKERNREKLRTYFQRYDAARRGKSRGSKASRDRYHRAYYQKNAARMRAEAKAYRQANPDKQRVWKHRRRAWKLGSKSDLTADQFTLICAAQGGRCAMCNKRRRLTIDHVIPISKGGPDTADNVQGLCRPCNSKKQAKDTDYRRALPLPLWVNTLKEPSCDAK